MAAWCFLGRALGAFPDREAWRLQLLAKLVYLASRKHRDQ